MLSVARASDDGLARPARYPLLVLSAFSAGVASVLAFAPFEIYPIGLLSLDRKSVV